MENEQEGEEREVIGRLKYIRVGFEFLVRILRNECLMDVVKNPLPKDTRFIRGGYSELGELLLVIESSEFPEIREGDEVPFWGFTVMERANFKVQS